MSKHWDPNALLALVRGYQEACLTSAAADLGVFAALATGQMDANLMAHRLHADPRALAVLLDGLAALELLTKDHELYALAPGLPDALLPTGKNSVLGMILHQGNCLRNWVQLATVVKTGQPAQRVPSIRGAEADQASFIQAMNDISGPVAAAVVHDLPLHNFTHLLDVGGASGTWTLAFLERQPTAAATIFDLPHVIPMAQSRIAATRHAARIKLVPGNFETDELPPGADLAWLSAIVHQQDRAANRALYQKIHRALVPGGRLLIRDMVMNDARTQPIAGALFAINMLVATKSGGTFTLKEFEEDLTAAGFAHTQLVRKDPGMHAVVEATKK